MANKAIMHYFVLTTFNYGKKINQYFFKAKVHWAVNTFSI